MDALRLGSQLSAYHAADNRFSGSQLHRFFDIYIRYRGQARDIFIYTDDGMDVRNGHYPDDIIIINENIGRDVMFNSYVSNTLKFDSELCTNCGMCSTVCPHGVFGPDGETARLVNPKACMECGACQLNCPTKAIRVDSGVGCASAMMLAAVKGQKEATCGCGNSSCSK